MGQTVNLLVFTFGGSNPSSPTPVGRFDVAFALLIPVRLQNAEVAQLIEHQPSKLRVASLSLVFRSNIFAYVAQG